MTIEEATASVSLEQYERCSMAFHFVSVRAFVDILLPFAHTTTLSGGSFTLLLDHDFGGITVTVIYERNSSVGVREASAYCEAIENLMEGEWVSLHLSAILVAQFETLPTTFAAVSSARSRHAMLILWNNGVWVTSKTTQARMVIQATSGTPRSSAPSPTERVAKGPGVPHEAEFEVNGTEPVSSAGIAWWTRKRQASVLEIDLADQLKGNEVA